MNRRNSKVVGGSGLGLWARPSAMTRIPAKSFSPQYPKLLAGPLNLCEIKFCNFRRYESAILEVLEFDFWENSTLHVVSAESA